MHVGDLDGDRELHGEGKWTAFVAVAIHDSSHAAVADARVFGMWSGAILDFDSVRTGDDGTATFEADIEFGESVRFTVLFVSGELIIRVRGKS